jgi:hypothetical protein
VSGHSSDTRRNIADPRAERFVTLLHPLQRRRGPLAVKRLFFRPVEAHGYGERPLRRAQPIGFFVWSRSCCPPGGSGQLRNTDPVHPFPNRDLRVLAVAEKGGQTPLIAVCIALILIGLSAFFAVLLRFA